VPAILVIGALQHHLAIIGHDGLHYLLSPNRKSNEFLSRWLTTAPLGGLLGLVRHNHLNHHRHLGEEIDQDRIYYDLSGRTNPWWKILTWTVGGFAGSHFFTMLRKSFNSAETLAGKKTKKYHNTEDVISVLVTQGILASALAYASGDWWCYFVLWTFPLFTVMAGLNGLRNCLEHANLDGLGVEEQPLSYLSNPVERFFVAPCNMNFHAEHHWFVAVPFYNLPELRNYLQERGHFPAVLVPSYFQRISLLARQAKKLQGANNLLLTKHRRT
jgi:fatty acid desaturase